MGTKEITFEDPLASALFGKTRQAVLGLLLAHPEKRFYQGEIFAELALGRGTVQRELAHLVNAAILTRSVEGRQVYYQANRECPVFDELSGLMRKTSGLARVLRNALTKLRRHIHVAFVYGSMARGTPGPESDVDVLVVGDMSFVEVSQALGRAQEILHREVNVSLYSPDEFRRKLDERHHFLKAVVAGPKIFLVGDDGELKSMAQIH